MKWIIWLMMMGLTVWAGERTQVHMGTMISVQCDDEDSMDEVFKLFAKLDDDLSTYKQDSEISHLNRLGTLKLSESTRAILERSLEISRLSGGVFDVTIGSLTHDAYRFGKDEQIPTAKQLNKALAQVGYQKLRLEGDRAYLAQGSTIDLGGIGKGYAVDRSIELLQKRGVYRAIVAASGDIGCLGSCDVRVTDPFKPDGIYKTLHSSLPRFAISTSGNYERYIKNKNYNHLLNPKTGKSERLFASVTLYGESDNTKLDALATAVAIMPLQKALALLAQEKVGYILMLNSGKIYESPLLEGMSFKD